LKKNIGKPYAGKPHVRFDEGAVATPLLYQPDLCIGGYHLYNPITKKGVSLELLSEIATELERYSNTRFYTCHCTGEVAFDILSKRLSNLSYLSCGETIEI